MQLKSLYTEIVYSISFILREYDMSFCNPLSNKYILCIICVLLDASFTCMI